MNKYYYFHVLVYYDTLFLQISLEEFRYKNLHTITGNENRLGPPAVKVTRCAFILTKFCCGNLISL